MCAGLPLIMNDDARRFFLVTGVLGGFTTFSALAVQTVNMSAPAWQAMAYIAVTFVGGVFATHLGHRAVNR